MKKSIPLLEALRFAQEVEQSIKRSLYTEEELIRECLSANINRDFVDIKNLYKLACLACYNITGNMPFRNQIAASFLMYNDHLIEMLTGEGKSIVTAITAVVMNIMKKETVHVLTFNSYLAQRDVEMFNIFFAMFDIKVAFVSDKHVDDEIINILECNDVVYMEPGIIAFTFLRTQNSTKWYRVLARMENAIIDEIDSIMVDKATVPYIISRSIDVSSKYVKQLYEILKNYLVIGDSYSIDHSSNEITLHTSLFYYLRMHLKRPITPCDVLLIKSAISAKHLLNKNTDYIIKDNRIFHIDSFTGRPAESMVFSNGIQQFIEIKEGINSTSLSGSGDSISLTSFLKVFYKSCVGLSGTSHDVEKDMSEVLGKGVEKIPSSFEKKRKIKSVFLDSLDKKVDFIIDTIIEVSMMQRRPVLLVAVNIAESFFFSNILTKYSISHRLLNAYDTDNEKEIVFRAGNPSAVTVTTNIMSRGVDIKIASQYEDKEEYHRIVGLGGLLVIISQHFKDKRTDRQVIGRCARQSDQGEVIICSTPEDKIIELQYSLLPLRFLHAGNKNVNVKKSIYRLQYLSYIQEKNTRISFFVKSTYAIVIRKKFNELFVLNRGINSVEDIYVSFSKIFRMWFFMSFQSQVALLHLAQKFSLISEDVMIHPLNCWFYLFKLWSACNAKYLIMKRKCEENSLLTQYISVIINRILDETWYKIIRAYEVSSYQNILFFFDYYARNNISNAMRYDTFVYLCSNLFFDIFKLIV